MKLIAKIAKTPTEVGNNITITGNDYVEHKFPKGKNEVEARREVIHKHMAKGERVISIEIDGPVGA